MGTETKRVSWSLNSSQSERFDISHSIFMEGTPRPVNTIISNEVRWQLTIYIYIVLCGTLAITGTISNVINMAVFARLGLKDSMSVSLFALSLTDFLVSFTILMTRIFFVWSIFYQGHGVDPLAVTYVGLAFLIDALFLCSGWIIMFLSLERCVCVVSPFKVKQIFTLRRSILAIAIIYIAIASTLIPVYATQWLGWVSVEIQTSNETSFKQRLVVMFSENRPNVMAYVGILSSSVVPVPPLVITFGSVLWMIYGLITSSKLRHSMTAYASTGDDGETQDHKLSLKTRKLVTVVLILAIVFLVCSVPRIIGYSIQLIVPAINEGGRERNLNHLVWNIPRVAASLNASVNIIVYLKINSAYQDKIKELFPWLQSEKK